MSMRLDIHINADDYLELQDLVPGKKYRSGLLYVQYDPENHVFSYTVNTELFNKELEARAAQIEADAMRAGVDFTGKQAQIVTRMTQISLFSLLCKDYAEAVEDMMKQLSSGYAGATLEKIGTLLGVSPEEFSRTVNRVAATLSEIMKKTETEAQAQEKKEEPPQTSSQPVSTFTA